MPAKKKPRVKRTSRRKAKPRSKSSPQVPCPNPDEPQGLEAIIRRMQEDPDFAIFIHDLLCNSYGASDEAQAARDCLNSYYKPESTELDTLCIPTKYQGTMDRCTVPPKNLLLAVPAEVIVGSYE